MKGNINMAEISVENVTVEAGKDSFFPPRLWVITYDLRSIGKGVAVVKAPNANSAGHPVKDDDIVPHSSEKRRSIG